MIDRVCISINNRCNLACGYCHFRAKGAIAAAEMDVFQILDHIKAYAISDFKVGFVGNGECFLDWPLLKGYIQYLSDSPLIHIYTITNGTIRLSDGDIKFLDDHRVNVGYSLDGYRELHNRWRCNSYDLVMSSVEQFKRVTGRYPTFNATVGRESLRNADRVISFFSRFGSGVTFSRMIGPHGIELDAYQAFLDKAEQCLSVRRGGRDCTMYGGRCGAGANNYFFANGKVYYCGNCIDLPPLGPSGIPFLELEQRTLEFDRARCYKELVSPCG